MWFYAKLWEKEGSFLRQYALVSRKLITVNSPAIFQKFETKLHTLRSNITALNENDSRKKLSLRKSNALYHEKIIKS